MRTYYFLIKRDKIGVSLRCPDFDNYHIEAKNELAVIDLLHQRVDHYLDVAGLQGMPQARSREVIEELRERGEKIIEFITGDRGQYNFEVTVQLNEKTLNQLEVYSEGQGISKSEIVRQALQNYFSQLE